MNTSTGNTSLTTSDAVVSLSLAMKSDAQIIAEATDAKIMLTAALAHAARAATAQAIVDGRLTWS